MPSRSPPHLVPQRYIVGLHQDVQARESPLGSPKARQQAQKAGSPLGAHTLPPSINIDLHRLTSINKKPTLRDYNDQAPRRDLPVTDLILPQETPLGG